MFTGVDLNAAFAVVALLLSAAAPSVKALNAACIAGVHEVSADDAFILPLVRASSNLMVGLVLTWRPTRRMHARTALGPTEVECGTLSSAWPRVFLQGCAASLIGVHIRADNCTQIEQLNDLANCGATATVLGPTQFPSLDYSVYASIVGSCAYETDGCPVTEQNLVDLVYGQIAEANLTTWPM